MIQPTNSRRTPILRVLILRLGSTPTFRPDVALDVHLPEAFNQWLDRLGALAEVEIVKLGDLLDALLKRHEHFHQMGLPAFRSRATVLLC